MTLWNKASRCALCANPVTAGRPASAVVTTSAPTHRGRFFWLVAALVTSDNFFRSLSSREVTMYYFSKLSGFEFSPTDIEMLQRVFVNACFAAGISRHSGRGDRLT